MLRGLIGMNKVIVIGCPGGGKSTFSRKLREKTNLPLFHLDMMFWKADKTTLSREEFDKQLSSVVMGDQWIIDGNYGRTLEMRLKECDTVFLFDLPVETCLAGAVSRVGKPREDMPWVEENLDEEFKQWILDFPEKELPRVYALLEQYPHKSLVVFRSHEQVNEY